MPRGVAIGATNSRARAGVNTSNTYSCEFPPGRRLELQAAVPPGCEDVLDAALRGTEWAAGADAVWLGIAPRAVNGTTVALRGVGGGGPAAASGPLATSCRRTGSRPRGVLGVSIGPCCSKPVAWKRGCRAELGGKTRERSNRRETLFACVLAASAALCRAAGVPPSQSEVPLLLLLGELDASSELLVELADVPRGTHDVD